MFSRGLPFVPLRLENTDAHEAELIGGEISGGLSCLYITSIVFNLQRTHLQWHLKSDSQACSSFLL